MAQKYKKAVMKVITILSECRIVSILVSICSIRFGFGLNNRVPAGGYPELSLRDGTMVSYYLYNSLAAGERTKDHVCDSRYRNHRGLRS